MNQEINIRKATEADIDDIVAFNLAMARETEGLRLNEATLSAGVKAVFQDDKKGFYLVAEVKGKTRGCLMITYEWSDWRNGLFWWIQSVYIEEGFRRKGLFKNLFKQTQTLTRDIEEVVGTRLYVEKDNIRAQETYLNLGMKKTNYYLFEEKRLNK